MISGSFQIKFSGSGLKLKICYLSNPLFFFQELLLHKILLRFVSLKVSDGAGGLLQKNSLYENRRSDGLLPGPLTFH